MPDQAPNTTADLPDDLRLDPATWALHQAVRAEGLTVPDTRCRHRTGHGGYVDCPICVTEAARRIVAAAAG